jgi:hypothetical protein
VGQQVGQDHGVRLVEGQHVVAAATVDALKVHAVSAFMRPRALTLCGRTAAAGRTERAQAAEGPQLRGDAYRSWID